LAFAEGFRGDALQCLYLVERLYSDWEGLESAIEAAVREIHEDPEVGEIIQVGGRACRSHEVWRRRERGSVIAVEIHYAVTYDDVDGHIPVLSSMHVFQELD